MGALLQHYGHVRLTYTCLHTCIYTYTHTFEVYTEINPQSEGINYPCLDGLPQDRKLSEQHPFWSNNIVALDQLLQKLFWCCKGLIGIQEGLHKLQIYTEKRWPTSIKFVSNIGVTV